MHYKVDNIVREENTTFDITSSFIIFDMLLSDIISKINEYFNIFVTEEYFEPEKVLCYENFEYKFKEIEMAANRNSYYLEYIDQIRSVIYDEFKRKLYVYNINSEKINIIYYPYMSSIEIFIKSNMLHLTVYKQKDNRYLVESSLNNFTMCDSAYDVIEYINNEVRKIY